MKTITLTLALASGISLLFLLGCATPQPVSRLYPIEQSGTKKWSYGNEMITLSAENGMEVSAAFRGSNPNSLIFEVQIRNRSGLPVLVSPEKFYYEMLAIDTARILGTPVFAIDPEKNLLEMDIAESRMRAQAQNETTAELIAITTDILDNVTTKNETEAQQQQKWAEQNARSAEYESSQANYNIQFRSLDEERSYWLNHVIRRNTLENGYEMRGSVFLPRSNQARFIRLNVVLENKIFPFTFWQVLYKP
ncbi:MAG: hypothetical protein ACK4TA_20835 [Saprospiraceae bacterium]